MVSDMNETKIAANPNISPYPMPVVIVGAIVNGRPNFMAVAWFGKLHGRPNIWGLSIGKEQYTLEGIKANMEFSINIPDASLIEKTDYVGIVSGRDEDKSIQFEIFYGKLKSAPMINECPLTAECKVHDMVDLPSTVLVLGEVVSAYTESQFTTNNVLDPKKVNPILLTQPDNHYWSMDRVIGNAFSDGKKLSTRGL
jgi:flavin reductase (DIM6/NTAB) family NADH-FMN oxidoreductase RutF